MDHPVVANLSFAMVFAFIMVVVLWSQPIGRETGSPKTNMVPISECKELLVKSKG